MARLLDSNLWIDLTRVRSPRGLKLLVARHVDDPRACIAEPIVFEVLRTASDRDAAQLMQHFEALPLLDTPANLWTSAMELGRECRRAGHNIGSIHLLIAAVAIHHGAELVSFDADFQKIAEVSDLSANLLHRPSH